MLTVLRDGQAMSVDNSKLGNIREPRVMPSHQKKELDGSNTGRLGTMATTKVQATLSREAYQRGGQFPMCRPVFQCFSMGYIVPP